MMADLNTSDFPHLPGLPDEVLNKIFSHLPLLDKLKLIWICKDNPDATQHWLVELPKAEKHTLFGKTAKSFYKTFFRHEVFKSEHTLAKLARTPEARLQLATWTRTRRRGEDKPSQRARTLLPDLFPLIHGKVHTYATYIRDAEDHDDEDERKSADRGKIEEQRERDDRDGLIASGKPDVLYHMARDFATSKKSILRIYTKLSLQLWRAKNTCGHCFVPITSENEGPTIDAGDAILCEDCTHDHCEDTKIGKLFAFTVKGDKADCQLAITRLTAISIAIRVRGS